MRFSIFVANNKNENEGVCGREEEEEKDGDHENNGDDGLKY